MANWQTRTIQINGVVVTYRVTPSLKHIQVMLNDNFASAEEFLSLRSMLAGLLHYREIQHNKNVKLGARINRFCKVNKAAAAVDITLTMQSEVIKQIINEIKIERTERRSKKADTENIYPGICWGGHTPKN